MKRFTPRSSAALMLVLHLGGWTTWQPVPVSPRVLIEEEHPKEVRMTTQNGTISVVPFPSVVNDSLAMPVTDCPFPVLDARNRPACPGTESLLPLSGISQLEVLYTKAWPLTILGSLVMLGRH